MLVQPTLRTLNVLTDLFEQAAAFAGRPRERLLALVEAEECFFRLHPAHYRSLQLIRVASQLAQSPGRDSLTHCESQRMALLTRIIADAVQCGDLVLRGARRPADVAFMLWSLAFGARALMGTQVTISQLRVHDGFETAREFADELLDALGWRPLTGEWDYAAVRARVQQELAARGERPQRAAV